VGRRLRAGLRCDGRPPPTPTPHRGLQARAEGILSFGLAAWTAAPGSRSRH
jgi:hypothetical protein